MSDKTKVKQVREYAKKQALIRPRDLVAAGLPKDYLYQLAQEGELVQEGRGLYRLPDKDLGSHQSLIEVAKRVPQGVVVLLSALRFHELTTQDPFELWMAIDRKARRPSFKYPPVRWVTFSAESMSDGVQEHLIEGVPVKVFSPAKTVADCFKYRNKIGLDVALEALREGWAKKSFTLDELHACAKICRVQKVMQPYL